MNKKFTPPHAKKKRNAVISVMLICALLITGIFAFLTATDSKTNRFTVGKIDIVLHEDNWDEWYENHPDADPEVDVPDFAENILPGAEIEKAPYVENTGNNDAYVFLTVETPAREISNFSADESGTVEISGDILDIDVKAYAIQTGYITDGVETPDAVWTKYLNNNGGMEGMFGAEREASPSLYEIFDILVNGTIEDEDGNTSEGLVPGFNDSWAQIGDVYQADGKNVYVFKYNVNGGLVSPEDETAPLFDYVRLNEQVGEPQLAVINYYANNDILDNSSSSGTGAGEDNTENAAPEISGHTLVASQLATMGSTIGSLYYGDDISNDKVNTTYTDNDTGKTVSSDSIIDKEITNVIIDQETIESLDNIVPSEYYVYEIHQISYYEGYLIDFVGIHEDYFLANEGNDSFNYALDIVVPTSITPTKIEEIGTDDVYYFNYRMSSGHLQYSTAVKTDVGYFVEVDGTENTTDDEKLSTKVNSLLNTTLNVYKACVETGTPIGSIGNSYIEVPDNTPLRGLKGHAYCEASLDHIDRPAVTVNKPGYKTYINKFTTVNLYQNYYNECSLIDEDNSLNTKSEYYDALSNIAKEHDTQTFIIDTVSLPSVPTLGVGLGYERGLIVNTTTKDVQYVAMAGGPDGSFRASTPGLGLCNNIIIRNTNQGKVWYPTGGNKDEGYAIRMDSLSAVDTVYFPSNVSLTKGLPFFYATRIVNAPKFTSTQLRDAFLYRGLVPAITEDIELKSEDLQEVYIYSSAKTLTINKKCNSLTDIYYEGTQDEFNALGVTIPAGVTVHYNQNADDVYEQFVIANYTYE